MNDTGPSRSRLSSAFHRFSARLLPTADAVLAGDEVKLSLGEKTYTTPFPLENASAQDAEKAVTLLLALLDQSALRIGSLRLVASDRWLRPLLFPLGKTALSDKELETVLEHQYRQVFGKLMVGWTWRWDQQPNGLLLAMAWPDALLSLRPLLVERGIHLVSALPQSLSAVRGLAIPSGPAWFVLVATECVTLVRLDPDGWRQWRVISTPCLTVEFVSSLLLRTVTQLDDPCRSVWILAPGCSAEQAETLRRLLADAGWQVHLAGKKE